MRSVLLTVVLLMLAGAGVWFWLSNDGVGTDRPGVPPGGGAGATAHGGAGASARPLPSGAVATRTRQQPVEPDADRIADAPTACLRIVDADGGAPLASAAVRMVVDGSDIAFSDEQGLAPVPLAKPAQLAVVHDGYLLRLVPTQLGTTASEPLEVQLVRDDWSIRRRFSFVAPDGSEVDDVFVLFAADGGSEPVQPDGGAMVKRAWHEQFMLGARELARDVAIEFGPQRGRAARVHHLASGVTVRFAASGSYRLQAATTSGLVANIACDVVPGPQPPSVRVPLQPGGFVTGQVLDFEGGPIEGAKLRPKTIEPLGLVATSDASGAFSIGPLQLGNVSLSVGHELHESIVHGPVASAATDVVIRLRSHDRQPLRGRVLSRVGERPIAGATVLWQAPGGASVSGTTQGDGTFVLQTVGEHAGTLRVQAPLHQRYAELVDPEAAFADYVVLPAQREVRLEHGMTALFEGVVLTESGTPVADVAVRWQPAARRRPAGLPGRRVLEGATLELPPVTTTRADGSFVLETAHFGPGRLFLPVEPEKAVEITAVAGKRHGGLELER